MKRHLKNRTIAYQLLSVALATSLVLPLPSLAQSVALATAPLATATTSTVKPNVMFILDDSGSMAWDFAPDWVGDDYPRATNASNLALYKNAKFNEMFYNPAITYKPPVHYNANGELNTNTYPSIGAPWTAVRYDAFGRQTATVLLYPAQLCPNGSAPSSTTTTATCNLVATATLVGADYHIYKPGEYCSSERMTSCVTATAPTTVSGVLYNTPAEVRWCNSTALTTTATTGCQSIKNATFQYPRYPGSRATITVALPGGFSTVTSTTVSNITVGTLQILSATTTGALTAVAVASDIARKINACTNAVIGLGTTTCGTGYSASVVAGVVTVYGPGGTTVTPVVTKATGNLTVTAAAFSGSAAAAVTVPGSNIYTNIVSTTDSYPYPGTTTKASTRTDCVGVTCNYTEEMTNYANWWTYYHTRMQSMKTSVSRAFSTLDNRYRVGFSTITDRTATNSTTFLNNNTFELAHKNTWYTNLFVSDPNVATPLRGALSKAGRYYARKITNQTQAQDPVQYSCQQNFTILSTDGYWNTLNESPAGNLTSGSCTTNTAAATNYGAYGLNNQTCVGNLDGGTTARPMNEGTTAATTLADVAKYYYDTDLRTSALGNCTGGISTDFPAGNPDVCTNNVFVSATDNNLKQHMTTFTMAMGIDGTLNYTSGYKEASSGDYYNLKMGLGSPTVNWPNPIPDAAATTGERIDDLWHAAVNGQGTYFSAKNPDEIIAGFNLALASIAAKLGAGAAAATSTLNPVAGNNFAYVASYTTNEWKGNLESRSINTTTGVVSESATWCVENVKAETCAAPGTIVADTSGNSTIYNCVVTGGTTTEIQNACTGTMPAKVSPIGAPPIGDFRTIYTAPAGGLTPLAGQNLVPFDVAYATANPTNFAPAHVSTLNQWASISAQHTGAKLLKYLRGQSGYEIRSSNAATDQLYRAREAVLGDALESQPAYIGPPVFSYPYLGYSEFKTAQAGRADTVYMGTNDGMMHAFAASDGAERWAYVPSMVIPNMWKLASTSYSTNHVNFVNGSPVTSDICTANCDIAATAVWKTILVGGLNGGGRGYYALDITEPTTPVLLWEFTSTTDGDLGYSFGLPVITKKTDGTWVVLVTSGYNNTSPGNGIGYLYVLDAGTGAIISKISTAVGNTTTPSGLAKIAGWNNEPAGNKVGYVYGGDLLGNVWRFDINSTANVLKFATLFDAFGTSQPITTTPVLGTILGKRVIFIGTGKYLETSDLTTTQVQTQYAIKDDEATATLVNPRTTLVQQTLTANPDGSATRLASSNTVNFATGRGWYINFPDSKERVNIDSKLVQGTLLVPTIVPSNTVCSPGGYGWLNFFDYLTGGAVDTTVTLMASIKYDSVIAGINVIYIRGISRVSVATATDPTPEIQDRVIIKGARAGFSGKRAIWRELIP